MKYEMKYEMKSERAAGAALSFTYTLVKND